MISKSQAVRKEGSAVNSSGLLQPDWRRDCDGRTTPKQGKGERKWKWTTPLRDSEAKSPLSHRKKLENDVQHCLCVTWKYWYGRVGVACPQACESETDPCDATAFRKALVHTREVWSCHHTKIQLQPSTRWVVKHKALAFWGHLPNNCFGLGIRITFFHHIWGRHGTRQWGHENDGNKTIASGGHYQITKTKQCHCHSKGQ